MALLSVRCNHCGAPLEVGDQTRFVTCQFCNSQLQVVQTESSVFTEVVKQIADQNAEMLGNLKVIELQNELERLDREWGEKKISHYVTSKNGRQQAPSIVAGVFAIIIGIVASALWYSVTTNGNAPTLFTLFGVIVGLFFVAMGIMMFTKSSDLSRDEYAFKVRREGLLKELEEVRTHRQQ